MPSEKQGGSRGAPLTEASGRRPARDHPPAGRDRRTCSGSRPCLLRQQPQRRPTAAPSRASFVTQLPASRLAGPLTSRDAPAAPPPRTADWRLSAVMDRWAGGKRVSRARGGGSEGGVFGTAGRDLTLRGGADKISRKFVTLWLLSKEYTLPSVPYARVASHFSDDPYGPPLSILPFTPGCRSLLFVGGSFCPLKE